MPGPRDLQRDPRYSNESYGFPEEAFHRLAVAVEGLFNRLTQALRHSREELIGQRLIGQVLEDPYVQQVRTVAFGTKGSFEETGHDLNRHQWREAILDHSEERYDFPRHLAGKLFVAMAKQDEEKYGHKT